jgi:hypothetical protein
MEALWCLKNDSDWAYKQALEGRMPDMHNLGVIWKRLEMAVIKADTEKRESLMGK